MVELIAIHTVQYLRNGKQAVAFPGSRFEMLDADAESVIRQKAAFYANPHDVVPVQAPVATPATDAPAVTESDSEPAPVEPETPTEPETDADAKPKRARKAKTEAAE
ncbi:hypothetical protein IQ03_03519 [Gemmobacter caeni]|uniref:Uncharacterized protein n=1 Tax=Gemmobacter caeni TaxID=589035 RepID=A0A2T6AT44_9RHOB|nr:hypothetical protein [Gemmobacter caeni]PTX46984.1 hypothetical protein C8N34_1144 [Gemmobacter caeni]TWI96159.1 hypothetical protein IQ03_03519 [Gemmobacter caeni]